MVSSTKTPAQMLHRLDIANFGSIREPQVIDLIVAENAPNDDNRLAPLWPGANERAPKVVALFGANASGKSNVLKALSFLAWFAKSSFLTRPDNLLPYERFNDASALEAPTRLAMHFAAAVNPSEAGLPDAARCRYTYEVTIGGPGNEPKQVLNEALSYWPPHGARRARLFERDPTGKVEATKAFGLTKFQKTLTTMLRPNASVIATLAQLQHPYATFLWNMAGCVWSNILTERGDAPEDIVAREYARNPKLVELVNRDIARIDLGIKAMHVLHAANGPIITFEHEGLAGHMPLILESHGTRQFLKVYPALVYTLDNGGIAILDELDASIHPMVLPEILRWFHDPERNPHNAQLWTTCHNASLLEHLSKEEVYFTEKDTQGRTNIYGLRDIQAVRRTDNYYRKYLGGAYGAVPQFG